MAPHVADVSEVAEELPDHRLGLAAVRALEVAVLHHGDGGLDRAPDVVALRIDVDVEVDERLGGAQQRSEAKTPRKQRGGAEQEPGDDGRAERRTEDAELGLLELRAVEGERRDSSATVKPTPAIVPPPATAAQPTGGRSLPPVSRVSSHDAPRIPTGLPTT